MLFSHPVFLFLFLPGVLALYLFAGGLRNFLLLVASLFFYAWGEGVYVAVMLLSIVGNYAFGLWIERARVRGGGKGAVAAAVTFNLILLVVFKYANWLWDSLETALVAVGIAPEGLPPISAVVSALLVPLGLLSEPLPELWRISLPIGISFFTFQAMSYVVDVYRGRAGVQRNPIDFGVYIALFPQLIAGPIVRYKDIAQQIRQRTVDSADFAYGVRRFTIGLAKKMLVANVLAVPSDEIFALPADKLSLGAAWFGMFCFSGQLYFDFSGYSDMAIGLGRMFGFRLLENFDYPYISKSFTEFWRRWHISLSTWFRDYVYLPLGGNRRGLARTYANLLLIFFLCGLWHGASWNYVLWGMTHGICMTAERLGWLDWLKRLPGILGVLYFHFFFMMGWPLFKEGDLTESLAMYKATLGMGAAGDVAYYAGLWATPLTLFVLAVAVVGSLPIWPRVLAWRAALASKSPARAALDTAGALVMAVLLVLSSMTMAAGSYNPFIYFRF